MGFKENVEAAKELFDDRGYDYTVNYENEENSYQPDKLSEAEIWIEPTVTEEEVNTAIKQELLGEVEGFDYGIDKLVEGPITVFIYGSE